MSRPKKRRVALPCRRASGSRRATSVGGANALALGGGARAGACSAGASCANSMPALVKANSIATFFIASLLQCELHQLDVAGREGRFAVRKVEVPDALEAGVKAQRRHLAAARMEGMAPAPQGFGVVATKGNFIHHAQPVRCCLAPELGG